eukprot:TRINITY_DN368_c1_g2_i3.p1 TRINITY_DN368_c1_g2~~TRINITY_DN368_c1_g2_i3.p1  ORF type:complete len:622 (-),score=95.12 TRINITY_DN368_c1_g2_i3:391-2256(-)
MEETKQASVGTVVSQQGVSITSGSTNVVWVKKVDEEDFNAEAFRFSPGCTISELKDILYASPKFALAPGTIEYISVGDEKEDNRHLVNSDHIYTLHLKEVPESMSAMKRKFDDLEERNEQLEREVKKLKKDRQFHITGTSLSSKKVNHPPKVWDIAQDIKTDNKKAKKIWKAIEKHNMAVNKESDLYAPFWNILQLLVGQLSDKDKDSLLWKDGNNHHGSASFPDFVIHKFGEWKPTLATDSANILVDFEIKQRFNCHSKVSAKNLKRQYPGDAGEAYVQALERSAKAFRIDLGQNYYVVVSDMENIIFWKMVPENNAIKAYGAGPYSFGGKYTVTDKKKKLNLNFPAVTKLPEGFSLLVALITMQLKAAAEVLTIINHDSNNSRLFQTHRLIGAGRFSLVFSAVDPTTGRDVCVKLEPLEDSLQLRNEVSTLDALKSVKGVPRVVFHGTTEFRGEKYCALVTDRIAKTSLCDLQNSTNLLTIAGQTIQILSQIHKCGFSHNDIKPNHIVFDDMGLFIIDFGSSTKLGAEPQFTTPNFCPVNALLHSESSEENDFEALWLSFVSLFQELPWNSSTAPQTELILKYKYRLTSSRWKDSPISSFAQTFSEAVEKVLDATDDEL